jgi:hypothetical protein
MEIFDTNDSFDFSKLVLTKPSLISGGNYFSRCLVNNGSLYIQPPKCTTKQGFNKAGKKYFCDLMFTNENENFIRWMENLENHCQQFIFKNREKWFDGQMELHDIENYFTSPLKTFKSGKYYIARVNVNTILNKPALKIYDENENEVDMESIKDNTSVVTIVEIQGIKCSSRSFQIEIDLKQMMILQPANLFEKCIIKGNAASTSVPSSASNTASITDTDELDSASATISTEESAPLRFNEDMETATNEDHDNTDDHGKETDNQDQVVQENQYLQEDALDVPVTDDSLVDTDEKSDLFVEVIDVSPDGLEEIDFNLEELKQETVQIKKRNDVYYDMYQEARRKAKAARDLALSSYLEAKRIKNTYMLHDIDDSDDSDLEMEDQDDEEDEDNDGKDESGLGIKIPFNTNRDKDSDEDEE